MSFRQRKKEKNINIDNLIRTRTPEAIMALKLDLCSQKWNDVYATRDPNQAYDVFLSTLMALLYRQTLPIKKTKQKTSSGG